jgi:low affinity Fe/Cu permease
MKVMQSAPKRSPWVRLARRTLRHPADRTEGTNRGGFERLAEYGSFFAGSPLFFALCIAVILVWLGGLVVGASNRFEAVIAGLVSVLTLILVALLKNAELRSELAIQRKLDAIASALLQDKRGEDGGDSEQDLEEAIGLHEEI